jgi:hypothetical protein
MKNLESIFAAYTVGWVIFFVYYVTVARRVAVLREDVQRLRNSANRSQ